MDGDTSKQCHEPFRQARDRSGIEKIPVVFPQAGQAILRVFHEQAKVEPCDFAFELERIHRQPRQFHGRRRHVLQNEKRLNQWIASQITLEFQRLHDPFERQVLMRIGFQGRPPHLRQQLQKCRVSSKIAAERQQIDEESDQGFRLLTVAIGHVGADEDVLLSRRAEQQRVESRQKCHEQGHALLAAQRTQTVRVLSGNREDMMGAPEGLHEGTRPVRRQFQNRRVDAQPLFPVGQMRVQPRSLQSLSLPVGEIRILHGQWR